MELCVTNVYIVYKIYKKIFISSFYFLHFFYYHKYIKKPPIRFKYTIKMNSSSETIVASEPSVTKVVPEKHPQPLPSQQVRWAPLRGIPIERRLQMLAVCTWISICFICISVFFFMATYKFLWPILIAYISFIYVDKAPETGGRRFESARHWTIWKYFAGYFPVQLIKVMKY